MKRPNFFIVGAPKSGTTALADYLRQHPDVFMPLRKELGFFGSDLKYTKRFLRPRNASEYLRYFGEWRDEAYAGEASVWYLFSTRAAGEIKEFSPSAKIIVMCRNPVEVMYSNYYQLLYSGNENLPSFEQALAAEPVRRRGAQIPPTAMLADALRYRDSVRFAGQLERYFSVFGRESVHTIIFDDFASDAARAFRAVLEFMQIDAEFRTEFHRVNPNKTPRGTFVWRLLRTTPLMAAARRFPRLAHRVYTPIRRLNTVVVERPPLDQKTERSLKNEMRPEIDRLGELLGRDLSHWYS